MISQLLDMRCKRVITEWSPAYDYCMLASGKIEGVVNNKNEAYDFLAGKLLVMEAGGIIRYPQEDPTIFDPIFIASNDSREVSDRLLEILINCTKQQAVSPRFT